MKSPGAVHEDFRRDVEVKAPSERVFGLTVAAALCLVAVFPLVRHRPVRAWALILAGFFVVLALLRPRILGPASRLWLRAGLIGQRLVTLAVMAFVFYGVVTPLALVRRLMGRDPLQLRMDPAAPTYWIERRPPGPAPETMRQQF